MFKRISNLFRGFMGLAVGSVEARHPEALLEVEKENLRTQIGNYNQGLASHAGLCERLINQVKKLEADERDLRAKTAGHLRAGNREVAGQYALRLQTVTHDLEENRGNLTQAEKTYQELVRARDASIKAAQDKIQQLKYALGDLKIKRATADLTEMASGMVNNLGKSGDTMSRLQEIIEAEREKAAGRTRVARDTMNLNEVDLKEADQKALADQALADFISTENITPEQRPSVSVRLLPGD